MRQGRQVRRQGRALLQVKMGAGTGVFRWGDGTWYDGAWLDDKAHGFGAAYVSIFLALLMTHCFDAGSCCPPSHALVLFFAPVRDRLSQTLSGPTRKYYMHIHKPR